jgi:hypothetical protein
MNVQEDLGRGAQAMSLSTAASRGFWVALSSERAPAEAMMASCRVEAFLRGWRGLVGGERRSLERTPDFERLMCQLKFRDDEPVPWNQLDLALELELRFPYSIEHYRECAEEARRRRLLA